MYDPAIVDAFREMCESGQIAAPDEVDGAETAALHLPASAPLKAAPESDDEIRVAMQLGAALRLASGAECRWSALATVLCTLPEVDTVAVFTVDEATERLVPLRVTGRHARSVTDVAIPIGERVSGWVAGLGQAMINAEAVLDLYDVEAGSLCSAAAFPCQGDDARIVVTLYSIQAAAFGPHHERLVEAAVSLLASRRILRSRQPGSPEAAARDRDGQGPRSALIVA